jgi:hypothetical protein
MLRQLQLCLELMKFNGSLTREVRHAGGGQEHLHAVTCLRLGSGVLSFRRSHS